MSRELIKGEDGFQSRVAVLRAGNVDYVESMIGPRTGEFFDLIAVGDVFLPVVSDVFLTDDLVMSIWDGGRLASANEISVRADSWVWPLIAPAIFQRSESVDDAHWALQRSGEYLEAHVYLEEKGPWQKGLVLASVKDNWETLKAKGLVEGEAFWGWARHHGCSECDEAEWEKKRGQFYLWMRAANVMLRNVERKDWIADLIMAEVVELNISKVNRCCGAIKLGLFDYSLILRRALLNPKITNAQMNHLIEKAKGHLDEIPVKNLDEETGEIVFTDRETGEKVDPPEDPILDEYLPDITGEPDEFVMETNPDSVFWTYNVETRTFGYFQRGNWKPSVHAMNTDDETKKFVDRIIVLCGVKADYEG